MKLLQHGDDVLKELMTVALKYNLVRLLMFESARHQSVSPDRVSIIALLQWFQAAGNVEKISRLIINPSPPDRIELRSIKRSRNRYT